MPEAYLIDAVRTPSASAAAGSPTSTPPTSAPTCCVPSSSARASTPRAVDDVVFGAVDTVGSLVG